MPKTIDTVIFDLDGTLIDSSDGVVEAVNYSLRKVGAEEKAPEEIKSFIGYPLAHMYPHFTDAPLDQLYHHFRAVANTSVVDASVGLPGAEETLAELAQRGYILGLATTKVRHNIDNILHKLNWTEYFAISVGGDEVVRQKPDPEAFKLALKLLHAESNSALVVGDTINDISAAQAVPVSVAAVKSPYGGNELMLELKPDYYFESVSGLLDILKK